MKKIFLFLFLLVPAIIYCQNTHEIHFKITDSVVVKKEYPYATKINLEINVPNFQDTFFLYYFYKHISSFICSYQTDIAYIIENKNSEIIKRQNNVSLYPYSGEDKRNARIGIFINSKQQIIRKKLSWKKKKEYNFAKYEINSSKQSVVLYLLLSVFHRDLPKGEYYLYLYYSFQPEPQYIYKEIVNDSRTFKGSIVSNKIKLIVE
ncbi:MAG: hypothetical protein LBU83_10155 [Bacteroidales bacterium]|jgi:hypothetical protein|nr:hypothetical protein [Bacteroidales bacterium]